ncbi:MAG: AraC family transcriptional regulator [Spirochaetota bacterium]
MPFALNRSFDPAADLSVRIVGMHETMPPGMIERPGTGDLMAIVFVDAAHVRTPAGDLPVSGNSIVVWDKGWPHCYGNISRRWTHQWLHFAGKKANALLKDKGVALGTPAAIKDIVQADATFMLLYREISTRTRPDARMLASLLENFFSVQYRPDEQGSAHIPEWVIRARWNIETHSAKPLTLASLALDAGYSVPHLSSAFRKAFGVSPISYLLESRLRKAEMLLANRDLRTHEVAAATGFTNIHYFYRAFKNRFGAGPREYRQRILTDAPSAKKHGVGIRS